MRAAALVLVLAAALLPGCGGRDTPPPPLDGRWFTVVTDSSLAPGAADTLRLIRLRDRLGTVHEGWLRTPPPDSARARPLVPVVILGGLGTGRRAATIVPCPSGYALLALDYPYAGPRAPTRGELIAALPAIHRAAHATPHGVAAAVRWLETRPGMDDRGALVVGASFGVPFVLRGLAELPRRRAGSGADLGPRGVHGVVLLYGGADLPGLARYRMRDRPAWERELAAWGLALGFADLEPGRWIGRVAPRPVLFVNGVRDELVGDANARLLHAKAGAAKTIVWLDTEHMQPDAEALLVDLVGRARAWADTLAVSASAGTRSARPAGG
jgi:hypothetical protein